MTLWYIIMLSGQILRLGKNFILKNRSVVLLLVLTLLLSMLLFGCGGQEAEKIPSVGRDFFAMDTFMTVTCYGEQCEEAAAAAEAEIHRLEELLSVGAETSEVSRLNAAGGGNLSEDTDTLLRKSLELYEQTEGAFDVTVFPLMELWGFTSGEFRVPAEGELEKALGLCGSDRLSYEKDDRKLTLGEGQKLDFGGIAKGYASDRLMELFEEYELVSGCVSLGGNVQCYGAKPDGSSWRIGIKDPVYKEAEGRYLGILEVQDKAMITSGGYERYFQDEETGQVYHHILDTQTGCPADSDLLSVTVVSDSGILADGLSTACYCMGLDRAIAYWRQYGEDFDLILMTADKQVYITEPLEKAFTAVYPVHIIER